jgi:hypothetical protein
MPNPIQVQKATGDFQEFSAHKIAKFLKRIKVPDDQIKPIVDAVVSELHDKTSTHEIADVTSRHLSQLKNGDLYLARYHLKRDIRSLGPDGHNFEKYIGKIFESEGYTVRVGQTVQGRSVTHEIDVIAQKDRSLSLIECKFHNREGIKSDVTIAMYIYARFLDIQAARHPEGEYQYVWLATNTKPTVDALRYAEANGMKILTVEIPFGNSIMDKVINTAIFPITSIPSLEPYILQLLSGGHVALPDVLNITPVMAMDLAIPEDTLREAQAQATRFIELTRVGV